MTNTITTQAADLNDKQMAALVELANGSGEEVHHRTLAALQARGLVDDQGELTDEGCRVAGIDVEPAAPVEAAAPRRRRSRSPQPCNCHCGQMTGGGAWMPGHDARWAGNAGRQVAALVTIETDPHEIAERIRIFAPAAASDALITKAVGVAQTTLLRASRKNRKA